MKRAYQHSGSRRAGFTLIETLMSSALIGVLLVAMGSAIALSSHAIPSPEHAGQGRLAAAAALERLGDDLKHARFVTERTATNITVVVHDRTGDGSADRIRYAWGGQSGGELTRQVNDATPMVVLENVHDLALDYEVVTDELTYGAPLVESTEIVIGQYMGLLLEGNSEVTPTDWPGQYIQPSLPSDAVSWRPTTVLFRAQWRTSATLRCLLIRADGNRHATQTALAEGQVSGSASSYMTWTGAAFDATTAIAPEDRVALVIRGAGGASNPAYIGYETLTGSGLLTTTDGGASWNHHALETLLYRLRGVVTRQGPPQVTGHERVTAVGVRLVSGDETVAPVYGRTHLRNEPMLVNAAWELNAEDDPATVDVMGDGELDWLGDPLESRPQHDFGGRTFVDLRMQDEAADAELPRFTIFADRVSGQAAELRVELLKQADGSQTLTLRNMGATEEVLTEVTNLPTGYVNAGLIVDAAYGTVHLQVQGREHGTYFYSRRSVSTSERQAMVEGMASGAVDRVRISVVE
ncbi:MAG: prepilin-type N-terminal cleavage/methylation domain-containing protein [Phycisphaeraceae bacterium]